MTRLRETWDRALTRIWRVFRVLPGQGGLGVGCFHYMGGVGAGDGVR